jgi:hypothetical protein
VLLQDGHQASAVVQERLLPLALPRERSAHQVVNDGCRFTFTDSELLV